MGIIKSVFDKDVLKVGDTLKINELQAIYGTTKEVYESNELIWYGQIINISDNLLEVAYIGTVGELLIEEISIEDVLEEVFVIEVVG